MVKLVWDLRVINVPAKFENDPWKIVDVRALTAIFHVRSWKMRKKFAKNFFWWLWKNPELILINMFRRTSTRASLQQGIFSLTYSQKTHHSLPVRASYGVSVVSSKFICLLYHIDGWVQERRNSIANALELRLSCTNTSICNIQFTIHHIMMQIGCFKEDLLVSTKVFGNDRKYPACFLKSKFSMAGLNFR